jgi:hypothetical protein
LRAANEALNKSAKKRRMTKAIQKIVGSDTDISHLFN